MPLFLIENGLICLITRFFLLSNKNLRTLYQENETIGNMERQRLHQSKYAAFNPLSASVAFI